MRNRDKGRKGEERAARFLEEKGWCILERNYQNQYGEIDIIAKDGEVLVFVEVKSWDRFEYPDLEYALDARKRKRIIRVARSFIDQQGKGEDSPIRFDVLFRNTKEKHFTYLENAFTETGKL